MNIIVPLIIALLVLQASVGLYFNLKHGIVPARHNWLRFDRVQQPIAYWAFMALRVLVIISACYVLAAMFFGSF